MARRAGSADLPLHHGRVPAWLGQRMARLGTVIAEAIIHHYGRDGFLRRLAHPFWFQSFGAVMGMDWHSSGITTSVLGALKRGLAPRAGELGLHVCGGRGNHSRRTPQELLDVGERTGLDGAAMVLAGAEAVLAPEAIALPAAATGDWFGAGTGWGYVGRMAVPLIEQDATLLPHARDLAVLAATAWQRGEAVSAESEAAQPVYLRDRVATPKQSV